MTVHALGADHGSSGAKQHKCAKYVHKQELRRQQRHKQELSNMGQRDTIITPCKTGVLDVTSSSKHTPSTLKHSGPSHNQDSQAAECVQTVQTTRCTLSDGVGLHHIHILGVSGVPADLGAW